MCQSTWRAEFTTCTFIGKRQWQILLAKAVNTTTLYVTTFHTESVSVGFEEFQGWVCCPWVLPMMWETGSASFRFVLYVLKRV